MMCRVAIADTGIQYGAGRRAPFPLDEAPATITERVRATL